MAIYISVQMCFFLFIRSLWATFHSVIHVQVYKCGENLIWYFFLLVAPFLSPFTVFISICQFYSSAPFVISTYFSHAFLSGLSLSLKMCVRRACIHQDMFVNISEPVVVGHKRFQTLISPFTTSNKGNIVHSVLYIRCVWHSRLLLLITASLSFFSSSLLVIPRLLAFVRSFDQESARWLLQQNSFAWWYLALA